MASKDGVEDSAKDGIDETRGEEVLCPKDRMDRLLKQCLLHSLKTKVKQADLPLPANLLYRNYMMPCCPEGNTLEIKKSSSRNFLTFLKKQQELGLLTVRERSEGVHFVTSVFWDHPELKSFVPPDGSDESGDGASASRDLMEVRLFVTPAKSQLPVLRYHGQHGVRMGDWLTQQEVRKAVTAYISVEKRKDDSRVTLDPALCAAVRRPSDDDDSPLSLSWKDMFDRFFENMRPGYQLIFPGQSEHEAEKRRGTLQPIKMKVERRAGWTTVIQNVGQFIRDLTEFGEDLKVKLGSPTAVSEGDNPTVEVKGNQLKAVERFLKERYKIPPKYIEGPRNPEENEDE